MVKSYRKLIVGYKENLKGHKRCATSGSTKTLNSKTPLAGIFAVRI